MAFLNPANNELQIKIVYAGPGRSGKTTNLEWLYHKLRDRSKSKLVAINTYGERTLFFDFFPLDLGKIMGHDVKIQVYGAPGQLRYNTISRLVLRGVDGIVFVADSMTARRDNNLISLQKLRENLAVCEKDIFEVPITLQYNKRDLAGKGIPTLSLQEMEKSLNRKLKTVAFPSSALLGINVLETLKKIITLSVVSVKQKYHSCSTMPP